MPPRQCDEAVSGGEEPHHQAKPFLEVPARIAESDFHLSRLPVEASREHGDHKHVDDESQAQRKGALDSKKHDRLLHLENPEAKHVGPPAVAKTRQIGSSWTNTVDANAA